VNPFSAGNAVSEHTVTITTITITITTTTITNITITITTITITITTTVFSTFFPTVINVDYPSPFLPETRRNRPVT